MNTEYMVYGTFIETGSAYKASRPRPWTPALRAGWTRTRRCSFPSSRAVTRRKGGRA